MKVEQVIIERNPNNPSEVNIASRVKLECEAVEIIDNKRVKVRLLEAGAGLQVSDEIIVHPAKLSEL